LLFFSVYFFFLLLGLASIWIGGNPISLDETPKSSTRRQHGPRREDASATTRTAAGEENGARSRRGEELKRAEKQKS